MQLPGPRIVAHLIETALFFVVVMIVAAVLDNWLSLSGAPINWPDNLAHYLIEFAFVTFPLFLYFALQETSGHRATVGKRAMGIRVEGNDGNIWKRNIARALVYELVYVVGYYGNNVFEVAPAWWLWWSPAILIWGWFAMSLFVGDGRTPYDRWAGTRVVRVEGR